MSGRLWEENRTDSSEKSELENCKKLGGHA